MAMITTREFLVMLPLAYVQSDAEARTTQKMLVHL
jgi:hypothetical protein